MNKLMTATVQTPTILPVSVDALLSQAIEKGVTVDVMERLVALREKMLAEEAKRAFNEAMAAFQAECPVIQKTKAVKTNGGQIAYKYAPIESVVEQVQRFIEKHGFRYSTTMQLDQDRGLVKAICRVVHTLGHEESSEMEVPLGGKTAIMSQSQQVAAASTFAKRYAFLNAFGIMTGDEDNDAQKQDEPQPPKQAPKAPPKPTVITVMEAFTEAQDEEKLNTLYERALSYSWTPDDIAKIGQCYLSTYAALGGYVIAMDNQTLSLNNQAVLTVNTDAKGRITFLPV